MRRLRDFLRGRAARRDSSLAPLRRLAEATPNLVAVVRDGRIEFANGASLRLLGTARLSDLLGRSVFDFVHPEDRERARCELERVSSASEAERLADVRLLASDGSAVEVELWLAPIRFRGGPCVLVYGRDRGLTRRAQETLLASEVGYRRLAENSSDIISEYTASGQLVYVSPSIERVLGYGQEEWLRELGPRVAELTHPDDLPRAVALFENGELPPVIELLQRVRHRNGEYRWLHTRGRRSESAAGEARVVMVSRDVTEEQRAMEDLRQSEARFQSLARAAPVGIFRIDNKGRHIYLNERWAELTGIPIETALAQPGARPLHPEDERKILEVSRRSLLEGKPLRIEQRIIRPDGGMRYVLTQAVPEHDASGSFAGWLGTLTDLTEKRASDAALAESEERLRLALEASDMCTWEWNAPQGHVSWSQNAARVFGLPDGEQMPTTTADVSVLVRPDELEGARELAYQSIARGEPFELEFRLAAREGLPERWIMMRGHGVPQLDGRAIGVAANVTARHQLAMERGELEARLREAKHLESLGLLAGGVAHDFNNLLVGILGNADLALDHAGEDPVLQEHLDEIRRSGDRAAGLVRQILAFAGRERVQRERIDLRSVVDDTIDSLRRALTPRTKLDWNPPRSPLWVDADATQLRQVLMNLIVNASEAVGAEGGLVSVGLSRSETAPGEPPTVALEVSDTGHGIDAAALPQIFDPFFTTKGAGRGLGLAVAHGIVRAHGGTVQIESSVGRGTRIRVLLPAGDRSALAMPPGLERRVWPRGQGTVLVVDDERGVREVARRALGASGYAVLVAANRAEAIAQLHAHGGEIGAIVLDLTLGTESGETVLAALREVARTTPVLAMSGYVADETLRRLESLGIAGFVQKPFTAPTLAMQIAAILERRAS
ncbi:MAG TPA: PAS domain S-box protein [Myxococcota bacterium]|nr:PAS domain S-box protein [Myxococcota bacterium]